MMNDKTDGSWGEYRRFVVSQLGVLAEVRDSLKEMQETLNEQKLRQLTLEAKLEAVLDGSLQRRISSLERSRMWAKGVGAAGAAGWAVVLLVIARFLAK